MPYILITLVILLLAIRAYSAENYLDKNSPAYLGNYAIEDPESTEALTVVSYNIWFGLKPEQALSELKEFQSRHPMDILLLQEMDEAGTQQIAQGLQLNYIYYPAAIEPTYHRNFGNAILSRRSILDPRKLILPHRSFSNRMNRIATRTTIRVHQVEIFIYSVHTESIFTLPRFREDQYRAVPDDFDPEAGHVIIGGDFNSFTQADVEKIERIFEKAGFLRASQAGGDTIIKYGIGVSADHVFTKGFAVRETGKMEKATASDHLPIWVTLKPT